jgi:lactoylglutathione lyase
MTKARLDLLMIRAADVERAVAFYRGLGLEFERERHGSGPVHYAARCGGTVFEIYPARPGEPAASSVRLGFCVPDLMVATATLLGAGGILRRSANPKRSVVIDPDGNRVELTAAGQELAAPDSRR